MWVFGVSNAIDASALVALGLHALQHRGQEVVVLLLLMENNIFQKKDLD